MKDAARESRRAAFGRTRCERVAAFAGVLVSALGAVVLADYLLGLDLFRSGAPGLVRMKANTALLFVLAGASLWLRGRSLAASRTAQALACAVAAVGLVTLVEYAGGWNLAIDERLFSDPGDPLAPGPAGRMAPNTALAFLALGLALGLPDARRLSLWREALALVPTLIGFVAITGYLYGARALYGVASGHTPMAANTALAFVVIGMSALLGRADQGVVAVVASPLSGGMVARQLLPAAVAVPIVLGWLLLSGYRAGLYTTEFRAVLSSLCTVVFLSGLVLWIARRLNRADGARRAAEAGAQQAREQAQRQSALLRSIVDHIGDGVVVADANGKFLLFNGAAERILGAGALDVDPDEWSRAYATFLPDGVTPYPAELLPLARTLRGESVDDVELRVREAGRDRDAWIRLVGRPLFGEQGELVAGVVAFSEITEFKRSEAEIRALNAELLVRATQAEAANRELETFSYAVSHDLRAPLRAIDGFSQALLEDNAAQLDDAGQALLARVRAAAQRMAQLIDALLELSRLARAGLRSTALDLAELAREIVAELERSDPARRVSFRIAERAPAQGDARLLRAVLENLLGNAWKFTARRASAEIEFGADRKEGETVYFVRDDGAGFDMAHATRLFGAFQRLHSRGDFEGTGIGLATVARIVHRHGGRVWAEAEPERGAAFYFTLAAARPEEVSA